MQRSATKKKSGRFSKFTISEEKTTLKDWGIDDDDVSYILLAQRVEKLCSHWKQHRPRKGYESELEAYNRFQKL